jgi:hypothetical protein
MSDLDILLSDEFRRAVEENLGRDPHRVALDRGVPHAALVASQVKYLGRAAVKLPSWYAARCIVPPLAFEQASSEEAAARKVYSGGLAVDLTCGLGVDTYALSRRFERVIAVERDPTLAAVARENFRRLGAENIEVVNASAEEFLAACATTAASAAPAADNASRRVDLVYIDPDRRNSEGKKMVRIEDCSPDVVALLPRIRAMAPRLVVKLSPLFDVDEVWRVFGDTAGVEVVSVGGECKEVVADVAFATSAPPTIRAVAVGLGDAEYLATQDIPHLPNQPFTPDLYRHLIIPDVALQKARLARRYFTERGVWIESDNGYGFAVEAPASPPAEATVTKAPAAAPLMGRVLAIESIEPFDPKGLKRRLKAQGIKSIDILKRDFPLSTAAIARQLSIREGGTQKIAFTRASNRLYQITLANR